MSGVALDKCSLLSLCIESIFWGLLLCLCMITVFLLLQKKSSIRKYVPRLVLVTLMFILCTMHVGLDFARVSNAFFEFSSQGPISYLENMTDTLYRFKYGVLFVQIFLGDLLIISRSFVLWNKNYYVVLGPTIMAVGTLVAAGGALHAMSDSPSNLTFDQQVQMWITASYTLALATKTTCLFLVMFRVRQIHSTITANVNRHVTVYTLMVVLVESGLAALLAAMILLITFVSRLNAHVIMCDVLSPITGLTVTAIVLGMTTKLSTPNPPASPTRPNWNRYSMPRSPVTPSRTKGWSDFDDDAAATSPKSPTMSRPESLYHLNQSTGTLNMAIVI
ncbi:hypothetical protein JB92DRAFT_2844416 [Gautieria morchelliformis]|nr:hypothetical protein JB92DRAFT_2844416 [Gautieria morchelliformis]